MAHREPPEPIPDRSPEGDYWSWVASHTDPGMRITNITTKSDSQIRTERAAVYGDPLENHRGIALAWAPLLHAHREAVARMEPLPEWVISLMMAQLKLLRMRYVYHEDNFPDARNYLKFTEEWQRDLLGKKDPP